MGLFSRKTEKRDNTPNEPQVYSAALPFAQLYQQNAATNLSVVFRATDLISDSIAQIPIQVKLKNGKNRDEVNSHPIYQAFDNNLISKFTLMKKLVSDCILKGSGFAYVERATDGTVTGIRYLQPGDVTVNYNQVKQKLSYKIANIPGVVEPVNMIHISKHTSDGITGQSILTFARRSINLANSTEAAANNWFSSGCQPSGILTVQGQLSSKQRDDIRNTWNQAQNGTGGGISILQGNMTYQPISQNSSDSQLLETREWNVVDIARFFGINPQLLGDLTHSSYSSLEATQQSFLLHTLNPWIVLIEQEFNRKLLKPSERETLEINLKEEYLLKTDKTALASYYSTMVDKGLMTRNEVRKELGLSPVDGGDEIVIPYTDISQNNINSSNNSDSDSKSNKTEEEK